MYMMTLLSICAVLLGIAALMYGAQVFAQWLAPRSLITVRPFNCATCLTFWLTFAMLMFAAMLFQRITLNVALFAVVFAFINYFYIKTKIQINE